MLCSHLAQRRDRSGSANGPSIEDRPAVAVEHEPTAAAGGGLDAQRYHRAPGLGSAQRDGREPVALARERRRHVTDAPAVLDQLGLLHDASDRAGGRTHADGTPSICSPRWPRLRPVGAPPSLGQDPRWRRFLVSRLPRDGGHVLDVATGTGLVAAELVRSGFRVTGLDQSPEMLAARARLGGRIPLVGVRRDVPFADARSTT